MFKFWFNFHWLVGITFGIVLAVVGFTGGLLSYEQPIVRWLSSDVMTVAVPDDVPALAPAEMLARLQQQRPEKQVASLGYSGNPADALAVTFAGDRRGLTFYANPYTGELTGEASGRELMQTIRKLHRWMLLDIDTGRPLVGIATALLILMAISGIYLRWPKLHPTRLRTWLALDWRRKGHSFIRHLHLITGTWVFLFYLLASGTGLWWSFDWYRAGLYALAGVEQPVRGEGPPRAAGNEAARGRGDRAAKANADPSAMPLDAIWQQFIARTPVFEQARLNLPRSEKDRVGIRYLTPDAPHERAADVLWFDARSGQLLETELYRAKPRGERFIASIFPLHAGSFFGPIGVLLMMLSSLAMPLFAITGWQLYLKRRHYQTLRRDPARPRNVMPEGGAD